ncbi:hypothetical protein T492DRAFT_868253, partial [Pavlovales sp. CCMP2436]
SGKEKRVSRLNLLFDGEDHALYLSRLQQVQAHRTAAEEALRHTKRVDELARRAPEAIPSAKVNAILDRLGRVAGTLPLELVNKLVAELHESYARAATQIDLDVQLPYATDASALALPHKPHPLTVVRPPARALGTQLPAPEPCRSVARRTASLARTLPRASAPALACLLALRREADAVRAMALLPPASAEPLPLDALLATYRQRLEAAMSAVQRVHLAAMAEQVANAFVSLEDARERRGQLSRFERLVALANAMLHDAIRDAIYTALDGLLARVRRFDPQEIAQADFEKQLTESSFWQGHAPLLHCRVLPDAGQGRGVFEPPLELYADAIAALALDLAEATRRLTPLDPRLLHDLLSAVEADEGGDGRRRGVPQLVTTEEQDDDSSWEEEEEGVAEPTAAEGPPSPSRSIRSLLSAAVSEGGRGARAPSKVDYREDALFVDGAKDARIVEAAQQLRKAVGACTAWPLRLAEAYTAHCTALLQVAEGEYAHELHARTAELSLANWLKEYRTELGSHARAVEEVTSSICLYSTVNLGMFCADVGE